MYCMQSKLKTCPKSEASINAGGCSFNSFLRRTVRFVGESNPLMPSKLFTLQNRIKLHDLPVCDSGEDLEFTLGCGRQNRV